MRTNLCLITFTLQQFLYVKHTADSYNLKLVKHYLGVVTPGYEMEKKRKQQSAAPSTQAIMSALFPGIAALGNIIQKGVDKAKDKAKQKKEEKEKEKSKEDEKPEPKSTPEKSPSVKGAKGALNAFKKSLSKKVKKDKKDKHGEEKEKAPATQKATPLSTPLTTSNTVSPQASDTTATQKLVPVVSNTPATQQKAENPLPKVPKASYWFKFIEKIKHKYPPQIEFYKKNSTDPTPLKNVSDNLFNQVSIAEIQGISSISTSFRALMIEGFKLNKVEPIIEIPDKLIVSRNGTVQPALIIFRSNISTSCSSSPTSICVWLNVCSSM